MHVILVYQKCRRSPERLYPARRSRLPHYAAAHAPREHLPSPLLTQEATRPTARAGRHEHTHLLSLEFGAVAEPDLSSRSGSSRSSSSSQGTVERTRLGWMSLPDAVRKNLLLRRSDLRPGRPLDCPCRRYLEASSFAASESPGFDRHGRENYGDD